MVKDIQVIALTSLFNLPTISIRLHVMTKFWKTNLPNTMYIPTYSRKTQKSYVKVILLLISNALHNQCEPRKLRPENNCFGDPMS